VNASREEALFALALEKPADKRAAFLDAVCEGDAALRQRLEALLTANDEPDQLAAAPAGHGTMKIEFADEPADEAVGQKIGRYKILEKVGEGGCGVVYVAEQTEPVRRRVALKVIKLGMDTKAVVARFEAERQALAMMDHPNIAKVLDAGTTDQGRPYFVMELVRGIRITDYCDQERVSTRERLDLFTRICHAIQHAHQKGIIHRDIKPSNILVTLHDGVPVPKVIDFGIAKATEGKLTDATVYTQLHQFIGTPAYMSPEQAEMSGLDIDTRSDIYSLGVLLYELLTGRTPFDPKELMAQGIDAMRKTIREKDPVRPSTKFATLQGEELTTTAKRRSAEASRLLHQLKGDLDWIVMKCLEKDRTRRYETANGLAADLRRHLQNEPVLARPPSALYKFQKAWRRNRVLYSAGFAVAFSLSFGISFSIGQAIRATKARNDALAAEAARKAEALIAQQERDRALAAESLAQQKARESKLSLYAADMKLAQLALADNDLGGAVEILRNHKPGPGDVDVRGFEWRYLWQQARGQETASLSMTNSGIIAVDFSPNGRWLAVAGFRGATIVDVAAWREKTALADTNTLVAIQFSPDGESLVTSGEAGVRIWDTLTWQPRQELENSSSLAAFSPDGILLATLGPGGLQIRDAHSLRLLHQIPGLSPRLQWKTYGNLAFSHDGRSLAALVEETTAVTNRVSIRMWHVDQLRANGAAASPMILAFPEVASVATLALSEDGRHLATSTVLGQLNVWDTSTGARLASRRDLAYRTHRLRYWAGKEALIGVCSDQTIRTWRQEGTNLVETGLWKGHLAEMRALAIASKGDCLATGDKGGAVKLWDTRNSGIGAHQDTDHSAEIPDHMNLLQFLSDSRTLVGCDPNARQLDFWDIEAGQPRRTFSNVAWHAAARVSLDQRWVAIARSNGVVELLDVTRQTVVATLRGHTNEVRRIFFTPDNRRLLTATVEQGTAEGTVFAGDSWVRLWEVPSGRLIAETNLQSEIDSIAMAPDGETFAVNPSDEQIEVRKTSDLSRLFVLPIREAARSKLAFSPDGQVLAVSVGAEMSVWDLPARRLQFVRRARLAILWLAFAPDGQTLASAGADRTVKLWNVKTGQEMLTLPFPGGCFQAEFSSDARTLAVGTYRVEGTRNFKVHLLRAPSLAETAAAEANDRTEVQRP
jgi:serine/threonine protein kinase/WD40 repeat protein